jgi:hypothetical protein
MITRQVFLARQCGTTNSFFSSYLVGQITEKYLGMCLWYVHLAPPMTSSFKNYFNLFGLIYLRLLDILESRPAVLFVYPQFLVNS